MRRRPGFTLIELSAVMAILSLVWISVTSVLYTMHRADHRLRDELQRDQALNRLAMRLRTDAHTAFSASLADVETGGSELVLINSDERSIHYGRSDEGVYRTVRQGSTVLHTDRFLVGRGTAEWNIRTSEGLTLVTLSLTRRDERSEAVHVRRINAAVAPVRVRIAEATEASS